jgi:hypothetical protein
MSAPNALLNMVAQLSPAEITYFKKHFRGKKRAIFSEMARKKKIDQKSLGRSMADLTEGTFAVYRSQISKELATELIRYRQRKNPLHSLRELQQQAESLQASGRPSLVIALLSKAVTLADEIEEFQIACDCIARILILNASEPRETTRWLQQLQAYNRQWTALGEMRHSELEVHGYRLLGGAERAELAAEKYKAMHVTTTLSSKKARIAWAAARAHCKMMLLEFEEGFVILEEVRTLVRAHQWLLHDQQVLHSTVNTYIRLSAGMSMNMQAREGLALSAELIEMLTMQGIPTPVKIGFEIQRIELSIALQADDHESFNRLSFKILAAYDSGQMTNLHECRRIAMTIIEQHIKAGTANLALRWVGIAYETRKLKSLAESLALIGVYEFVAITMLGDWERLATAWPRVLYAFKSRKQINPYTQRILDGFKAIAAEPTSVKTTLASLCSDLDLLPDHPDYIVLRQMFDFKGWVTRFLAAQ